MARKLPEILSYTTQCPAIRRVYHLAYYQAPRYGYQDVISKHLQDFKSGREPQTENWIRLAAPRISRAASFTMIIRALHSNETTVAGNSPLDRLCQAIATEGGAIYAPERLHKTKDVRPMGQLGAKAARQAELAEVYQFNDSGLPESAKILLVDDLVTTGSTLEAIAAAIRKVQPTAVIECFVLGRTQAFLQNTHLDQSYFESGPASKAGPGKSRWRSPDASTGARTTPLPLAANAMVGKTVTAVSTMITSLRHARLGGATVRHDRRQGLTRLGSRVVIPVVLFAGMLLGASILIQPKTKFQPIENDLHQLMTVNAKAEEESSPDISHVRTMKIQNIRLGIVTVPSMGLRANHSLESKVVPKARIKAREKVEILRKFSVQTSPDWYQVRTKSGKVGWVLASMVRESRK